MDKILIADDTPSIRITLKEGLSAYFPKFEIEAFESGEGLVKRLGEDLTGVRIALIDNDMRPGITGSEIIKRYSRLVKFPFVLDYGGDEEIDKKAMQNGAFGYLIKPASIVKVKDMINRALEIRS